VRLCHLANQLGERELVRVSGVLLIAQEHDPVPEPRRAQLGERGRLDITANPDPADDRADHAADLSHLDALKVTAGRESQGAVE